MIIIKICRNIWSDCVGLFDQSTFRLYIWQYTKSVNISSATTVSILYKLVNVRYTYTININITAKVFAIIQDYSYARRNTIELWDVCKIIDNFLCKVNN